jgi:general secretion pathway protein L
MFGEFLTWWVEQLSDLVPERLRRLGLSSGDALVIAPAGPLAGGVEAAQVSLRRSGNETPLGRFALASGGLTDLPPQSAGKPVVLQLAETDVLSKTITLPLSTERELEQVLGFEMERETPFSPEEIFWNHRIARRDRERGLLSVRLLLVPRASLAALLDALAKVGIAPRRAEIAAGPDRGCYLPLDADRGRLHVAAGGRALRWAAAACCAGLAIAVIVTPFVSQNFALADLKRQVGTARKAFEEKKKLNDEITRLSAKVNLIDNERNKAGHPLVTLAVLTSLLPDDTYLTGLQQQHQTVTLSGGSATRNAGNRLYDVLAHSNQLHKLNFAAPVTWNDSTKSEVFTITAEVGPSPPT